MSDEPITEDWLRACGFKWEQLDRQPSKHWLLWLADACIDPNTDSRRMFACNTDLGIEVAHNDHPDNDFWYCWLRADYAGRYSRFLHVRRMAKQGEVIQLIEALTGRPWNAEHSMYGSLYAPQTAEQLIKDRERLDHQIATQWGQRVDREQNLDPDKMEIVRP